MSRMQILVAGVVLVVSITTAAAEDAKNEGLTCVASYIDLQPPVGRFGTFTEADAATALVASQHFVRSTCRSDPMAALAPTPPADVAPNVAHD
jgi:hypothetical protein